MRRAPLAVLAAGALAGLGPAAAAAPAQMHEGHGDAMGPPGPRVSEVFAAFAPAHVDAVVGETVTWTNDSARAHDVVATDQRFDSGRMSAGETFSRRFDEAGVVPFYCSIHPFMTGEVDIHPVLLDAPAQRAGSGKPFVLTGRAAAGTSGTVTIEGDDGSGFARAGSAPVAADGTFRATVVPRTTTTYRPVVGDAAGPPVQLLVLDHAVTVTPVHRGRDTRITVRVAPAAPGETVVLQLRLRDRFGWWPVQRVKLGRTSTATFVVRRAHAVPGRVLLTLPDGATELARSRAVRVGPAA